MSFKLEVVKEVERGELSIGAAACKYGIQKPSTVTMWLRKYGNFDWQNQTSSNMPKTPEQKILELEQKVKLLEKQKAILEKQVETSDKKAIIFDMMIDLAEKDGAARAVSNSDKKKLLTRAIDQFRTEQKETLVSTCGLLGVSRQVYYRQKSSKTKHQQTALKVIDLVQSLRLKMPRIGIRKLYYLLREQLQELGVGRDRLFSILNANHLCIYPKRSYHVTTNSHHRNCFPT